MSDSRASELIARIDERRAKVVVVGQGYVGLPVAMRAAEVGFPVVGYDLAPGRVEALRAGRSYVEDVTDEQLAAALARGYLPTHDPADLARLRRRGHHRADAAARGRPRPLVHRGRGARDLAPWLRARRARRARVDDVSRAPPKSCSARSSRSAGCASARRLLPRLLARAHRPRQPRVDLREHPQGRVGHRRTTSLRGGRGVLRRARRQGRAGRLDRRGRAGEAAREHVPPREHRARSTSSRCSPRDLGVDIWSAIDAASTKPFGFMRFTPGPGVGGHCLPIDPSYLAWQVERRIGQRFRFVELANDVNRGMPDYVVARVTATAQRAAARR